MSFCVPEWGTGRCGGMLNAVAPANDYHLQLAPKGRGDSIRHQRAHFPDLPSVPDQDSLELAWMENRDAAENAHFDMQCPTAEGCSNSELQVNYAAANQWGDIGQGMEDRHTTTATTVLPSKSPAGLMLVENELPPPPPPPPPPSSVATVAHGDQALPIINVQDDEMISWLQDPPEDSLDHNYGVDLDFGELPVANIQVNFADAFSGPQSMMMMTGRSAARYTQLSGISGNNNYAVQPTRDAVNADMAMTLGACRAAGLIRQGAGVEAFSQVRTLQALGTRQPPGMITSSPSLGLGQGLSTTESQNPFRASSPMSGSPLAPAMLPLKSKPPVAAAAAAATTSNSLPSINPLVEKAGAMNFPVFARPAALIKANLQSLNMASILPSNLMCFKPQQGSRHANDLEAAASTTSTSSSITELNTQGQQQKSGSGCPRDRFFGMQNELEMQFEAQCAAGLSHHQSPNLDRVENPLSPMPSSVTGSRKEVQAAVTASAGPGAMYCGSVTPKDREMAACRPSSRRTTGSATVPASSDLGVSQTTSIPELQEPSITSGSGPGAAVRAYSDPGGVSQGGPSLPEVREPTIMSSSLGGSGSSTHVLKRVVKETTASEAPANKKKKVHDITEEVECGARAEHESLELKKPAARGSMAKRNRAAEVHNLSERRRRDRINEKMKSLQELIPNSNKTDKASMLDEAIEYIKMLQLQLQMMSMRSAVNLPPMVLPSGIQRMQMPQMPRMPQMAMGMGMGMGMGVGLGMGMMDMGATGSGQGVMPAAAMSFMGPVPHTRGVPSMMAEAHDACLVNANVMDPRKAYVTHPHQAMQIQQPMNNEMYNAYLLQQHQQQQQQQFQQYQLQQEHHQSFTMAAGPPL